MKLRKMLRVQIRIPGNIRVQGKPLEKAILEECREEAVLGATVIRSAFGYGEHEYRSSALRGLGDLPLFIEIVDDPQMVQNVLPRIKELVGDHGLITIDEVFAV